MRRSIGSIVREPVGKATWEIKIGNHVNQEKLKAVGSGYRATQGLSTLGREWETDHLGR